MHIIRCKHCGEEVQLPSVLRCPFCNKNLEHMTDEYSMKHIQRCAYYLSPYHYSDRGPGRPKKSEYMRKEI